LVYHDGHVLSVEPLGDLGLHHRRRGGTDRPPSHRTRAGKETHTGPKPPASVAAALAQTRLQAAALLVRLRVDAAQGMAVRPPCPRVPAGLYFLSYPIDGSRDYAPGYMTLNKLIPEWMDRKDKFYPNLGTGLLLFLLARADPDTSIWRRLLNSSLAQYLGKISFGLYLVHGPILHAVGYMIPHRIWWSMGVQGLDTTDAVWTAVMITGWTISLALSL
ncbi:acyltransferase, partial [Aspergillus sclerotialis]